MATALSSKDFEVFSRHSELVPSNVRHEPDRQPPPGTPAATGLDAAAMIRALRAISAETLTDKLVETLMVTAVQHAGVERGLLIAWHAEVARVEAEATTQRHAIVVRRLDALPDPPGLPETIVKYVMRTQETVILDDASIPNPFSTDPYVAEHRVRSLLCFALVKDRTPIGALYLEDRRAHMFTPSRIGFLELLVSQAAVALENARLSRAIAEREHLPP
jgi:GAF domain-containing protein